MKHVKATGSEVAKRCIIAPLWRIPIYDRHQARREVGRRSDARKPAFEQRMAVSFGQILRTPLRKNQNFSRIHKSAQTPGQTILREPSMNNTGTDAAIDHFNQHRSDFLNDLKNLVRIPSISFPGFDPAPVRKSAEAVADLLRTNVETTNSTKKDAK